jgi:hypothetical protein
MRQKNLAAYRSRIIPALGLIPKIPSEWEAHETPEDRRTRELSAGTFSIHVHNVLADDDVVVVLVTINAQRNGVSASFPEVHVWEIKNGKVIAFREYQAMSSKRIGSGPLKDARSAKQSAAPHLW